MSSFKSRRCSWSLALTVGSLVVLVSAVHVFVTPLFPSSSSSLQFFGGGWGKSRSPVNGSSGSIIERLDGDSLLGPDLEAQFPADSHGAVIYRGAPWKAEIGRWLSGCGAVSAAVDVVEV